MNEKKKNDIYKLFTVHYLQNECITYIVISYRRQSHEDKNTA